jgi:hypothetical protein
MRLLIIIASHEFDVRWKSNIDILYNYMKIQNIYVDFCGISNQDDFHNYEDIITFKYKIVNTKKQFSKICDFITDYKTDLQYDWYMKIRPDIMLLENINFDILCEKSINARARGYHGPKQIKYGSSVNGEGFWKGINGSEYSESEHDIVLDDMLFIFHNNVIQKNAFDKIEGDFPNHELLQTETYNNRNIPLNVIGIYLKNTRYNGYSGNINM